MTENNEVTADQLTESAGLNRFKSDLQFQSTIEALKTAKKALLAGDEELYEQVIDFCRREVSRKKVEKIGVMEAIIAFENEDWETCRNYMDFAHTEIRQMESANIMLREANRAAEIAQIKGIVLWEE